MKFILPFFLTLLSTHTWAQDLYLVNLKPKTNTQVYFSNPLSMLSQRALDRRANRSVVLDEKDVPIASAQVQQIKNLNLVYVGASKWLNTIMVEVFDENVVTQLQNLSFVQSVESMVRNPNPRNHTNTKISNPSNTQEFNYGYSNEFIQQLNLEPLHNAGFKGQNVLIGVIDSGFPGVNTNAQFSALRNENRIVDTYNFVNDHSIYEMDAHGAMVLSNMAAKLEGTYIGTAPDAHYALYVSEDATPETPKELMYWIQAAERADSIGVDVINTSLGYTTFDDPRYDYTYDDMNGNTTIISKGANIAASRGIFVVNAMGNDGDNDWHFISAPADAEGVFSIGANDSSQFPANFTSYGPNAVGIYKPNVSAMGVYVPVVAPNGNYVAVNGTSFASPIMAGSIATLMSAFPTKPIDELKTMLQQSAHLYPEYSDQLGYGVPNFGLIYQNLATNQVNSFSFQIYPNPANSLVKVESKMDVRKLELFTMDGRLVKTIRGKKEMKIEELPKGIYALKIEFINGELKTTKVVVQ